MAKPPPLSKSFSPTAVYRTLNPPPAAHSVTALYRLPTDLFYFKTAALGSAEELLIGAINIKGFKETTFCRNPNSFARQTSYTSHVCVFVNLYTFLTFCYLVVFYIFLNPSKFVVSRQRPHIIS